MSGHGRPHVRLGELAILGLVALDGQGQGRLGIPCLRGGDVIRYVSDVASNVATEWQLSLIDSPGFAPQYIAQQLSSTCPEL